MRSRFILLVLLMFLTPCLVLAKDKKYPDIPYLGKRVGGITLNLESTSKHIIEVFRPNSNIWYIKVPRGFLGEEFTKKSHYSWAILPLVVFDLKFECELYLYTRDIDYDYYRVDKK